MAKFSSQNQHIYSSRRAYQEVHMFVILLISAEKKCKTLIKNVLHIRTFYLKTCEQIDSKIWIYSVLNNYYITLFWHWVWYCKIFSKRLKQIRILNHSTGFCNHQSFICFIFRQKYIRIGPRNFHYSVQTLSLVKQMCQFMITILSENWKLRMLRSVYQ